jgi:large subunit ribosomal protein L10
MRPEKATIVADIQAKLRNSPFLLIADYSGMQVKHFEELRTRLGRVDAEMHVIRNTFIKRAIKALGLPELNGALSGQNAMVTGENDICAAARFSRCLWRNSSGRQSRRAFWTTPPERRTDQSARRPSIQGGPSSQAPRAPLAPATKLVRVLNEPASSLARVLKAKAETASQ